MNAKKPSTKSSTKKPLKPIKKTKEINLNKKPVGREPKYQKWMCEVAERLANQGNKQKDIYKALGISEVTGISYKNKYKEFSLALEKGYEDPIKVAEKVLYKLVKGYEFNSEQIVVVSDGSQIGSHWERVPTKKRIEPNLRAVEYALNNWKPRKTNPLDGYGEMLEVSGSINYKVIPDDNLED
jgi:hypothetical protein